MSLIGIDLSSGRARAVAGPRPQSSHVLALEGRAPDLPLAINLEGSQPNVGRAGALLARRAPHLACLDFLPYLGTGHIWSAGRHRLDAERAVTLTFEALKATPAGRAGASGCALSVPAYLDEGQAGRLAAQAEAARWRVIGTAPASLLAAHTSFVGPNAPPFQGVALVAELDGHALTWSAVVFAGGQARLAHAHSAPALNRSAWLMRLLDGVAHRCVKLSRRDPRESAEAEQALFDQLGGQLDGVPDGGLGRQLVEVAVQAKGWAQHLMLRHDELAALVAPLLRQAMVEMDLVRAATAELGEVGAVVLTAPLANVPGLVAMVRAQLQSVVVGRPTEPAPEGPDGPDFGEELLADGGASAPVYSLPADALARAAHGLAALIHRGEVAPGHHEALPLAEVGRPALDPVLAVGPPRLQFRGQDHILSRPSFTLGRDPDCDLVFESELYPGVSARHCEVLSDRSNYTVIDRSRHGTLLNERPVRQMAALHAGDWLRLGPAGPVLRFLGGKRD
jgi:hypothetical protein